MLNNEMTFSYDRDFTVDGVDYEFQGSVTILFNSVNNWRIYSVDGFIIEDPENATETIFLNGNPKDEQLIIDFLKNDDKFSGYAEDEIRFHYD